MEKGWNGKGLQKKNRKKNESTKKNYIQKMNGIELGWNNFSNEAKKIRKGIVKKYINGIDLEWKWFEKQSKKKKEKEMIPTNNKWQ